MVAYRRMDMLAKSRVERVHEIVVADQGIDLAGTDMQHRVYPRLALRLVEIRN